MEAWIRPRAEGAWAQRPARAPGKDGHRTAPAEREGGGPAEGRAPAPGPARLERLLVRGAGRLVVVRIADVDWIEGAGNYVRLHLGERSHLVRQTMGEIERRLDPARFARIHRSAIVNLDRVAELRPTLSGSYRVLLTTGERLTLSRNHRKSALERVSR
jgi:two-component system LytT family response regulator